MIKLYNTSTYAFIILQGQVSSASGGQGEVNWSQTFRMLGQFFFLIFAFLLVLVLTYYVTRGIGMVQHGRLKGSNMQIMESLVIGPQKMLQLVKVGERFFLIGITKDSIVYLSEMKEEHITLSATDKTGSGFISFEQHLKKWMDSNNKDRQK